MPYNAEYISQYREAKLNEARDLLGGKCAVCGSADNLQFDHIDRASKIDEVRTLLMSASLAAFWAEVAKCQLLCRTHHDAKTAVERMPAHGSKRRYGRPYGCRCTECWAAARVRDAATYARRKGRS